MGGFGSGKKNPDPVAAEKQWQNFIDNRIKVLEVKYEMLDGRISQAEMLALAEYQQRMEIKTKIGRLEALAAREIGDDK